MLGKESHGIKQPLQLNDRYPVDAKYIAKDLNNLLYSPGHYEGIQVSVQYDPEITANLLVSNPTWTLEEAIAENPTGKVYKLLPLVLCNCLIEDWGTDFSHWEPMGSGANVDHQGLHNLQPDGAYLHLTQAQADYLNQQLFTAPAVSLIGNPSALQEKGVATSITVTPAISLNSGGSILAVRIYQAGVLVQTNIAANWSAPYTVEGVENTTAFAVQVDFEKVNVAGDPGTRTGNRTVTFTRPIYSIAGPLGLSAAQIQAGTKLLSTTETHLINYASVVNGRMYFAIQKSRGLRTSILDPTNAEVIASFLVSEATFSFADGTEVYYIYMNNANFNGTNFALEYKK